MLELERSHQTFEAFMHPDAQYTGARRGYNQLAKFQGFGIQLLSWTSHVSLSSPPLFRRPREKSKDA